MGKAVAASLVGLALLFTLSLLWGWHVFTAHKSWVKEHHLVHKSHGHPSAQAEEQSGMRKAKLAFSSFDLVNGLTVNDLKNLYIHRQDRVFAFVYLVACLWMVWGLEKPRGPK